MSKISLYEQNVATLYSLIWGQSSNALGKSWEWRSILKPCALNSNCDVHWSYYV